ncbi:MAG: alpha/beta fold hydrolase [Pseudomonadota bacterium]
MPNWKPGKLKDVSNTALNIIHRRGKPGRTPVVFVHGAWHGAWCWQGNFFDFFADAGHPIYALDLRGHGDSPAVRAMRWNRIRDYADDVAQVISECDQPPVVVGHSMGGFITQHLLARDLPLAGACLLASAPAIGVLGTSLRILRRRPVDFARVNLHLSLYPLVETEEHAAALFLEPDADPEIRSLLAQKLCDESYMAFLDMLVLSLPRKPANPPPVLVIGGAEDRVFTVTEQRKLAARFDAPCHILPGTPHDIMLSRNWRTAADLILDWMGAQS